MNRIELHGMIDVHKRELVRLNGIASTSLNCKNCEHWQRTVCGKAGEAPPPEVQRVGCDDWLYNEIPF